ncbi:ABC transporter substrate-binding protein [Nesterenkonia sp. HG001]|uniref:ABC transporter substrate-binding protein n=1 Tax=Nesterenkonia sp. HG001 TaxID=2983207 RepID=UPI002AC62B6F|nr:ABC transporter substrate-binding protein [Nesterenkonia sp. HG001]MDZ5078011.1 ABC transporter substrate-binding protein [Nesterenkonia sp. HG001]
MSHTARRRSALSIAVLSGLLLTACGNGAAGAPDGATITLYTSEPQEKIDALLADFREVEPDIQVDVFRAGTGDLTARLETDLRGGGPGADVFLAADAPTFEGFKEDGLLRELDSEELSSVSETWQDPEGYYVGTRVIPTVIAYNTHELDTPPSSWQELSEAAYDGQITLPDPAVSGAAAFNSAVWYLHPDLGESWFDELGANSPVIAESNGPVGQAVAEGSQPVGIVVDFMMRDLRDAGSPVEVSYPAEGVPSIYQPIGIFEATEEPEAAQTFVDYVISRRGQEFAVEQNYLPVRTDAGSPEGAPALEEIKFMDADLQEITEVHSEALDAFNGHIGG